MCLDEKRDLQEQYNELLTINKKLEKKLNIVIKLGDRQEKQMRQLNEELKKYIKIVDKSVIISKVDRTKKITSVSEALCQLTGYAQEELIGKEHPKAITIPSQSKGCFDLWQIVEKESTWNGEIKIMKKNGETCWLNTTIEPDFNLAGELIGYTTISYDISDKKRIEELSKTDELTGLYNRREFNHVLSRELENSRTSGDYLSLIMLDIDSFKTYNDTYGHQQGDKVLQQIGCILNSSVDKINQSAFRLGGEEFAVIVLKKNPNEVHNYSEKIRKKIEDLHIDHQASKVSSFVTVSIGVQVTQHTQVNEKEIYRGADEALYQSKEEGRNRVTIHEYILDRNFLTK